MHRAERLGALFRHVIESRHAREILEGVIHLHLLGDTIAADGSKRFLHARLDDENHLVKTRADRVIDGILHQDFAVRTETVHLLVSAVTGTHTGSHNQKRCTHIYVLLDKIDWFLPTLYRIPRFPSSHIPKIRKTFVVRLFLPSALRRSIIKAKHPQGGNAS